METKQTGIKLEIKQLENQPLANGLVEIKVSGKIRIELALEVARAIEKIIKSHEREINA